MIFCKFSLSIISDYRILALLQFQYLGHAFVASGLKIYNISKNDTHERETNRNE